LDSNIIKLIKQIVRQETQKPKPYDTVGTVQRVEGSTAWVIFGGADQPTPVRMSIDSAAGDVVNVRVSNGLAWITGNDSHPPTDDEAAVKAAVRAELADQAAKNAKGAADDAAAAADDARKTATNFLYKSSGKGLIVSRTPVSSDEEVEALTEGSIRLTSKGLDVYDGPNKVASYKSIAVIGNENATHSIIDAEGIRFYLNTDLVFDARFREAVETEWSYYLAVDERYPISLYSTGTGSGDEGRYFLCRLPDMDDAGHLVTYSSITKVSIKDSNGDLTVLTPDTDYLVLDDTAGFPADADLAIDSTATAVKDKIYDGFITIYIEATIKYGTGEGCINIGKKRTDEITERTSVPAFIIEGKDGLKDPRTDSYAYALAISEDGEIYSATLLDVPVGWIGELHSDFISAPLLKTITTVSPKVTIQAGATNSCYATCTVPDGYTFLGVVGFGHNSTGRCAIQGSINSVADGVVTNRLILWNHTSGDATDIYSSIMFLFAQTGIVTNE
jgi:hypothetical protein